MTFLKKFSLVILFFFSFNCIANAESIVDTDAQITHLLQSNQATALSERIESFSATFLNAPYLSEPLGEGPNGGFNQEPLYRLDGFDCQTFVETVMALALSKDLDEFKQYIIKIRYKNAEINFAARNHFPSADWLPNNMDNGLLEIITQNIAGSYVKTTTATINRKSWYEHLSEDRIKIPNLSADETLKKFSELKAQGEDAKNTVAQIDYIPLHGIVRSGKTNIKLLAKIPNGAIILLVAHYPRVEKIIGTQINVTHMGFAIWKNNKLYFRAASTWYKKVVDIPLADYLKNFLGGPYVKGISIVQIK